MRRRDFQRTLILGGAAAAIAPAAALARLTRKERVDAHNREVITGLFPEDRASYPFEGIVVHHTATKSASLEGIGRYHAKRFGDPRGIQYHFLIDNGKRRHPPGWIHVGMWQHQAPAIHLFKPELAVESVAICLVGNFEQTRVHRWQLDALVSVSQALIDRLQIALPQVRTHRGVDGILTQCPGKRFPLKRYLERLSPAPSSP